MCYILAETSTFYNALGRNVHRRMSAHDLDEGTKFYVSQLQIN